MVDSTVVIDTNVLVAAGFNAKSNSAQIVAQVRCRRLRLVWNEQTRQEADFIIGKIPPLLWESFASLFRPEDYYGEQLFLEPFPMISDKSDIKFVALSNATGSPLITMDQGLLSIRDTQPVPILMPHEFLQLIEPISDQS